MGSHITESLFFKDQYACREMQEIFSSTSLLQKWLDTEAALARAEAKLGLIPVEAALEITAKANANLFDKERIREQIAETGHPIVPMIREFSKLCVEDHGQYIHWGATTQDIMDTASALQMKEAHHLIYARLAGLQAVLLPLAKTHKKTVMAGRTHGQHALPVTFGYKIAIWIAEFERHMARLIECRERLTVGQFSGAAGTLASVGEHGLQIQRLMMEDLGLGVPVGPWHVARDHYAEFVSVLGLIAATVGKVANEIIALQKTEVMELEEPFVMGKVGSSTMPHKRNPMKCENIVALTKIVRANVPLVMDAMIQEHERDMGPWQVEWEAIPETCMMAAAALEQITAVMEGLIVYPQHMQRNLGITGGLIVSEALMMFLAPRMGRLRAHDAVYEASMQAFAERISLKEAVLRRPELARFIEEAELERVLDPANYIGLSEAIVDAAVSHYESSRLPGRGKT